MFKKLIKKGVALACGIVMSFSVVGCADQPESKVTYDIWTTYNTMKVIRETSLNDNYVKMEKGINVKMAKAKEKWVRFTLPRVIRALMNSISFRKT